ncbi:hypothetical protein PoB_002348200 [Plakobranchus ocellatus]|uniref:Uncharacterized protein n=1 Tax=Plakobranchus ocellatus TaxID=259542 RepID=A0AAV3ZP46_9GAST|nr:hypothetical protein PoB_002348200 [Plakobranchus ocellatus]
MFGVCVCVCVCVVIGSSDLVTTQAGSADRRDFGWDRHFDFITRTVQSLNGPGARGRVTCLVNDSVSEVEKVNGELKGHGWDCYHCVSHELFERDPGYVGAKDLTLGLSVSMNYISYSTTSSTDEVRRWIKLRSVCLCE